MSLGKSSVLLLLGLPVALAGCAGDRELYPSLSVREEERVTGVFDPVEAEEYVPAPPRPATLDRLAQLRAEAASAHERFLAAAERARRPVAAARTAQPGSEDWAVAQVALADLESSRSDAMVALADLDRIHADAIRQADETDAIEEARGEVDALVLSQSRLIEALYGELPD